MMMEFCPFGDLFDLFEKYKDEIVLNKPLIRHMFV